MAEKLRDVAFWLNPLKKVTAVARTIAAYSSDRRKHVWIGKRTLSSGYVPVGLNIAPGLDLYHYAIMIRGIVYQISGRTASGYCQVDIDDADEVDMDSFDWYVITNDSNIVASEYSLRQYARSFENRKYNVNAHVVSSSQTAHCQTFCHAMLMYACNMTNSGAANLLNITLGNLLI